MDAEANMLKWKELACCLNSEEQRRLDEIRDIFVKNKFIKGDDKIGQAVMILSNLTDNLEMIKDIMAKSNKDN
jgi:hypothetical protein